MRFLPMDFTEETISYMNVIMIVVIVRIMCDVVNETVIYGIVYAGGESKSVFITEALVMWLIIVPAALIGIYTDIIPPVVLLVILLSDDTILFPFKYRLYKKKRWLRNITE